MCTEWANCAIFVSKVIPLLCQCLLALKIVCGSFGTVLLIEGVLGLRVILRIDDFSG
jgi:hypothetical protein